MKKALLILTVVCMSFSVKAQINPNKPIKDFVLTDKPTVLTPVFPKADPLILEMVANAEDGVYKISMASLNTYPNGKGNSNWSTPLTSTPNKLFNVHKFDEFTIEGAFQLSDSNQGAAGVKIYTTKLGGKKMTIRYTEGANKGLVIISNLEIKKNGNSRYIITGEAEKDGSVTSYIIHIFRYFNS